MGPDAPGRGVSWPHAGACAGGDAVRHRVGSRDDAVDRVDLAVGGCGGLGDRGLCRADCGGRPGLQTILGQLLIGAFYGGDVGLDGRDLPRSDATSFRRVVWASLNTVVAASL